MWGCVRAYDCVVAGLLCCLPGRVPPILLAQLSINLDLGPRAFPLAVLQAEVAAAAVLCAGSSSSTPAVHTCGEKYGAMNSWVEHRGRQCTYRRQDAAVLHFMV